MRPHAYNAAPDRPSNTADQGQRKDEGSYRRPRLVYVPMTAKCTIASPNPERRPSASPAHDDRPPTTSIPLPPLPRACP